MSALLGQMRLRLSSVLSNAFKSYCVSSSNEVILLSRFKTKVKLSVSNVQLHASTVTHKKRKTAEERRLLVDSGDYSSVLKKKPVIEIWRNMTVAELAHKMNMDIDSFFELMMYVDNTEQYEEPTSIIDDWKVCLEIVTKAGFRPHELPHPGSKEVRREDQDACKRPPPNPSQLVKRPPVVTVMGHVDHGKTTLLDTLRNTNVVLGEFGGITQHIGAFSVKTDKGDITFLDTPGHAAFSAMRSRGAHCTDIVVLVVAADDGVMEQTVESIRMARDAKVPIIVAINKIDKPGADIERTKKMLMMQEIVVEDVGGDVQAVAISALRGTNVNDLVDAILAQAEISEIKGDPTGFVEGVVIESKKDPHRGMLCTVLVQRGTLRRGCVITAGLAHGKVRAMFDVQQRSVREAPPSTPVEVVGWKEEQPHAGDIVIEVESEQRAQEVMRYRKKKKEEEKALHDLPAIQKKMEEHNQEYKPMLELKRRMGVPRLFRKGPREKLIKDDDTRPRLNIVLKADVDGSVEAIMDALDTYNDPRCRMDIVHCGVGKVSPGDVTIAKTFNAVIYNFNTGSLPEAKSLAHKEKVEIRPHNIIYRLMEDVKKELTSRLPPKVEEEVIGEAVVLELFFITPEGKKKSVPVAGCRCTKGELKKSPEYKVIRDGQVIHTGKLECMRHMKDEVTTIKKEQECGLMFHDTSVIFKAGDVVRCFRNYNVPQQIKWDPF